MTHREKQSARLGFVKWARPLAIATACALLSACGSEFAADAPSPGDQSEARLGGATEHNIAALAARESDLTTPRRIQPRDAGRRDAVLSAYRQNGSRQQGGGSTNAAPQQEGTR